MLTDCIAGVMKQVDKAMAKDEAERLKRILNKELGSIREDIKWEAIYCCNFYWCCSVHRMERKSASHAA